MRWQRRFSLFSPWIIAALFPLFFLNCAGAQVREESQLAETLRLAAENDNGAWKTLERLVREPGDAETLDMRKQALTGVGKIRSARSETLLRENLNHPDFRGMAAEGLMNQRGEATKQEIDSLVVDAAQANLQKYPTLSRGEIFALGESDDPRAVTVLKNQLGMTAINDDLIIEALGKILLRRNQSIYVPDNFLLPLGEGSGSSVKIEELSMSDKATEPKVDEEGDPEKVLLNYLAGDGSIDSKDKAATAIRVAHPNGIDYLLGLTKRATTPLKARMAIVDYLTRYAVDSRDSAMFDRFLTLRRRVREKPLLRSIDLSLQLMGQAFGRRLATGTRRRAYSTPQGTQYDPLPKEAEIVTLTKKPYPAYSAADVKTNLKKALKYYGFSATAFQRMQERVESLLSQKVYEKSSERNLIFVALARLYKNKDFYVLREKANDAFSLPGYFTTTLRIVTTSKRGRSWQVVALQRVWNLTASEAEILRQIYLRDAKVLQQRLRL